MTKLTIKLHKKRNPIAQAPILRKGGIHEKSRKTKRQKQKGELRNIVRNDVAKTMAAYRGHCSIWCFINRFEYIEVSKDTPLLLA